jgi:uncharacterized membrane protein
MSFLLGYWLFTKRLGECNLVWNLFLAWIPYGFAVIARTEDARSQTGRFTLFVLGSVWLVFFPNAPYLLTDLKHYLYQEKLNWWYDLGVYLAFALTGCFLAVASLEAMQIVIARRFGVIASWLFAFGAIALSGVGVYLGRFIRLNSWDLILRPHVVLSSLNNHVLDPHPRSVGVSVMFALILLMCHLMFVSRVEGDY